MKSIVYQIAAYITKLCVNFIVLPNDNKKQCDNGYKIANLVVSDKSINKRIRLQTEDKSTMTEDTDKFKDCDNNNKSNCNQSYTYYSYDQRVFK
jgi:hypothetical protein